MKLKQSLLVLSLAVLGVLFAACGGGGTIGPAVNGVTIDRENLTLGIDQTATLTATVEVTGNAAKTVTWESSDPNIAAVDPETGVVTGVAVGTATITATSAFNPTKSDSVMVVVTTDPVDPIDPIDPPDGGFPVMDSNDDAEEFVEKAANANYPLNCTSTRSSDLDITNDVDRDRGNQLIGLRFANVTIPQGATITGAYIQFTADVATSGPVSFTLKGQAADNATAFVDCADDPTAGLNNISSRDTTAAEVIWTPGAWMPNEAGANQQSADLSEIIEAIVNRPGWASGNALAVIISGPNSDIEADTRIAKAYDDSAAAAPVLVVTYE